MNGMDRLIKKLSAQMEKLPVLSMQARDESASHALIRAKGVVPVRTGYLRASLKRQGGKVFTLCPYARFVELGTCRTRPKPYLSVSADMAAYRRLAAESFREAID